LFEDAACGLLVTAADGTLAICNRTFCRWIGYSGDELVGRRKFQDLLTIGGRIFHQTHWAPLLQMQGSVAEVKLEVVHRDGHSIPMVMNAVRHEREGSVSHGIAVFVAEDRHKYERELLIARRRAEEALAQEQEAQRALTVAQSRLRLALDSARLFVWDIEPTTKRRRYDRDVALLLGYGEARAVGDDEFAGHIHPDDREREADALASASIAGKGNYNCVYRLECIDNVQRSIKASGHGTFDGNGNLLQFVGILQDVTELSRQREEAEDRALFAEQMVGIVSHDLRNPLGAIQMSATLLARGELTPTQLRAVGWLTSSSGRANRLIADLLDFTQARLRRGLQVTLASINLRDVISSSIEELRLTFPGRLIEYLHQGGDICVADADRLMQMIGNLVANALAYGATDRPVTVRSVIELRSFELSVRNEGPPIAEQLVRDLFKPMTRGHTTASGRSVGLGLFIVREIVRAHGGDVSVASTIHEGTTFVAKFPQLSVTGAGELKP